MHELTPTARFRRLHVPGSPLVLFNVWDVGSARALEEVGASAIATSSWAIATAYGFDDGELMPRELMLETVRRIVEGTGVPVTVDLESGYGQTPDDVARTVGPSAQAGAVGCNLEDRDPSDGSLRTVADAAARIEAARRAADAVGNGFFLNARTDVFLSGGEVNEDDGAIDDVLRRSRAYSDAGADGFFVPGLTDLGTIRRLADECPLPLNVMRTGEDPSIEALADAGVARISHGPMPYLLAMEKLRQVAASVRIEVSPPNPGSSGM